MKAINRILHLIDSVGISQAEFCKITKLNPATISNAKIHNGFLKESTLAQVLEAYPKLSATWLLLGEGEMWATTPEDGAAKLPKINDSSGIELDKCQERLQAREREIEALRAALAAKDELIALLKNK